VFFVSYSRKEGKMELWFGTLDNVFFLSCSRKEGKMAAVGNIIVLINSDGGKSLKIIS
jgi:hypothetical protein